MTQIRLLPPEVIGHELKVSWTSIPALTLFEQSSFTLKFPPAIDLSRVPESLLWRVALICLHSLWVLVEPCRVEIPVDLPASETEVLLNLIRAEWMTLNAHRATPGAEPSIEIVTSGLPSRPESLPLSDRCLTAFSGGKDSLVQTGLLVELTTKPVLVAVTSPMPLLDDHLTERRRLVLDTAARMSEVELIEVESNYRANIDHSFAAKLGYVTSVNEITDTFLYLGALVIVAAALGARHLFLASERDVQENTSVGDGIVQHPHFMYSVATQRALSRILERWGMHYSSLISPLYSHQSQALLVLRYPDLWRLQYSCWRVRMGEAACNACTQCLRIAFGILALGRSPGTIGLKLGRILRTMRKWTPLRVPDAKDGPLPRAVTSARLHAQIVRSLLAVEAKDVYSEIRRYPSKRAPFVGMLVAWSSFLRLRRLAQSYAAGPAPGHTTEFLEFVDPFLREHVTGILASHFRSEEFGESRPVFLRSVQLSDWITSPICDERMTASEKA